MNSKTKEVYYEDMYLKELAAKVQNCRQSTKYEDKWELELDKTIFYPEGGGQYGDRGWIFVEETKETITVFDTYHEKDVIIHLIDKPIKIGSKIEMKLDWELRYARMQEHSGEHLVSGLIVAHYGYQNVGFHMGNNDITIDYNGVVEKEILEEIEIRANKIIYENLPIEVLYPSLNELEELAFRSKKELDGQIRLIRIKDVDLCACCGTHVKTTGEIGLIHFTDIIPYKGGSRITMQIGIHALFDYIAKDRILKKLRHLLSAKTDALAEKTKECLQKQEMQKQESWGFQLKYLHLLMETTFDEEIHFVNANRIEQKLIPGIVNERMAFTKILVFVNSIGEKNMVTIASRQVDLSEVLFVLRKKNLLKGGGSKTMLCGEWIGELKEIKEKIKEAKEEIEKTSFEKESL